MTKTDSNPEANQLPAGVTAEQLEAAVRNSGYPLQRVVAEELLRDFKVTEEWGYLDRESKEHRTLDVFGIRRLSENAGLWLSIAVLVECKRSYTGTQPETADTAKGIPTAAAGPLLLGEAGGTGGAGGRITGHLDLPTRPT